MHLIAIGGSDAGISAALRARELEPGADVTVVVADAYPNFSICGIPYYVSGEVTHWRNLAHRTVADLEADRDAAAAGHHRTPDRRRRPQAPGHRRRRRRGTARLRQADRRHRRGPGPPADQRPDRPGRPRRRRWRPPAAFDGRHLRRHAHPRAEPAGHRGHRRRRLHRPGDGRRPDHPRAGRHPDGAAARGPAHRRPGPRPARPRPARRPGRRGTDRHHRPADHPRQRRRGGRLRVEATAADGRP